MAILASSLGITMVNGVGSSQTEIGNKRDDFICEMRKEQDLRMIIKVILITSSQQQLGR